MLRVLLDATAVPANRGGVGRYVDNLIPALVGIGWAPTVVCRVEDAEHYGTLSGSAPLTAPAAAGRRPVRLAWEQTGLAALVRRVRPDVLHCPHYTLPVLAGGPVVVTLHDATFFSDPRLHTRVKGPFFRSATALALRRARRCIVPSQATADELVDHADADPDRLDVAHLGVDADVFAPPSPAAVGAVRTTLGLRDDERYIAFLGTLEPRKNVPALVRGWVASCHDRGDPPALVLAGGRGWDDGLAAALAEVPARLRLIRPGYLPLDQLAGLLGGAEIVAYPSLGEGFGLPVLEAMSCGAAVLTTRRLALPEVGGHAVAYCGVEADSIAVGLRRLLDHPHERAALRTQALRRAAEFSWPACARAHAESYERAAR